MRQAGRYLPEYKKIRERHDVLSICKTPELASEITVLPVEKFDVDAAVMFADITLPLESMGVPVTIKDEVGPIITTPIRKRDQLGSLKPFEDSSISFVYDGINQARRRMNDSVPVIGFSGAPFTLASYLIEGGPSKDFARTKVLMHQDELLWRELAQMLSSMVVEYFTGQVRAGATALQLFDSWVGCLSPHDYEEYVLPYSRQILRKVASLKVPLIHFGTNTASLLGLMREAGGDVISVDWRINIDDAWERIGQNFAIQGNLDPATLLGNLETVRRYAREILNRTQGKPGHIFSLGHGVLPTTPPENVGALVEFVHSFVGAAA